MYYVLYMKKWTSRGVMNNYLGTIFKLLNLNTFCIMSLLFVKATEHLSLIIVFIMVNFLATCILMPLHYMRNRNFLLWRSWRLYTLRAIFNIMGLLSWISGIKYIGANEATAVTFCIPIFTALLSTIFCNEKLNSTKISALFVSLLGALVIIYTKLGDDITLIGLGLTLFSSICWALYDIICKLQTTEDDFISQCLKNFLYSGILSIPLLFVYKEQFAFNTIVDNFQWIFWISITSSFNIIFLFLAYKYSMLTTLMPLSYLRLVFMSLQVYIISGIIIDQNTLIGAVIIAGANITMWYKERRNRQISS